MIFGILNFFRNGKKSLNHTKGLWKICISYVVYSSVGLVCRVLVGMYPCMHLGI